MYATLTTTHGSLENMRELGELTAEEMFRWLRGIDGFEGLVMLTNEEAGVARVLVLWASEEVAERHRAARERLRAQVTAAVDVEVQDVSSYDVAFVQLKQTGTARE